MMQKRRPAAVLPVTGADVASTFNGTGRRVRGKRKARKSDSAMWGVGKLISAIVGLGLVVVCLQRFLVVRKLHHAAHAATEKLKHHRAVLTRQHALNDEERVSPLGHFSSLKYALDNADLVLLYFAASWCPKSTPVTEKLDELFRDVLLPPPAQDAPDKLPQRRGISLVFVSSDNSATDMEKYVRPNWMVVPFDSPERNDLKRHFKTCAKPELEALGMERKHEIPTLIVIDGKSKSHNVLSFSGTKDVEEHGAQAIDQWMELSSLTSALEEKYSS